MRVGGSFFAFAHTHFYYMRRTLYEMSCSAETETHYIPQRRQMMEIIAFVATIIIGFAAESALGSLNFDWQSGGAVFAIAVMGTFILWAVRHNRSK